MAEKPVPDNDPLVKKSLASWYVVSHRNPDGVTVLGSVGRRLRTAPVEGFPARMERPLLRVPEDGSLHFGAIRKRSREQ